MKNAVLFTLGTPFGCWLPLADHLCASAPEGVDLADSEFVACHERAIGPAAAVLELAAQGRPIPSVPFDGGLLDAADAAWGGVDERTCWTVEYWAKQCPEAVFLIFVEPVATALARRIASNAPVAPDAFVTAWREGAERILRMVRKNRARVLVVDTQDAISDPTALLEVCSERLGLEFSPSTFADSADNPDPLSLVLSRQWVEGDKQLRRLCAELEASCTPLRAEGATHAADAQDAPSLAALSQYIELRRVNAVLTEEKTRLGEESSRLGEELGSAQSALADERSLRTTQQAEFDATCDSLRSEISKAREESEILLLQLHQVQEELEATFIKSQELEKRCVDTEAKLADVTRKASETERMLAESAKAHQAALAEATRKTSEVERKLKESASAQQAALADATRKATESERKLTESVAALKTADRARAAAEAALSAERAKAVNSVSAVTEQDSQRVKLQELTQENELLLLQLHQVQEELEHYFLANQKLLTEQVEQSKGGVEALRVRTVQRGNVCDEAPHRHVNFTLRDVEHRGRKFALIDVRLVEHHGTPGLALFADQDASSAPLASWEPTGQENGRAFMLLHPAHKHSRKILAAMTASDWQLVTGLADLMVEKAADVASRLSSRWRVTALRLREQLAELPPQFRYDSVRVSDTAGEGGEGALDIEFENAGYGRRRHPQLRVRWQFSGKGGVRPSAPGSLELVAPKEARTEGDMPPLATWPVAPDGAWAESVRLHFGRALSAAQKRSQWASLSAGDQAFIISLLNKLPNISEARKGGSAGKGPDKESLASLAELMTKDAQRAMRPAGLRGVARALILPAQPAG